MVDTGATEGRLAGRVVLITGAESGIGRATAVAASREGATVAAIGLATDGLEGIAAVARIADVADPRAVTAAVEAIVADDRLGGRRLDVVHANAGVLTSATPLESLDLDEWQRVLGINLSGVVHTFRAALPHVTEPGGLLLVTGSSLAIRPRPGLLPYVAAKAGVHAVARCLALELAPRGIRVNVIAPGLTETPMTVDRPGHIEASLPSVPLGALVPPEEVAALAVHLMTDESRSVTGSVFTVDGGRTAG